MISDLAKDVTSSSVLCLRIALTDIPILVDCKATTTKCPSTLLQTIQYINYTCFFFRLFYLRFKTFNYSHSGKSTHIFRSNTGVTNASSLRSTTSKCGIKQWTTEMNSVFQGEMRVRCKMYVYRR